MCIYLIPPPDLTNALPVAALPHVVILLRALHDPCTSILSCVSCFYMMLPLPPGLPLALVTFTKTHRAVPTILWLFLLLSTSTELSASPRFLLIPIRYQPHPLHCHRLSFSLARFAALRPLPPSLISLVSHRRHSTALLVYAIPLRRASPGVREQANDCIRSMMAAAAAREGLERSGACRAVVRCL